VQTTTWVGAVRELGRLKQKAIPMMPITMRPHTSSISLDELVGISCRVSRVNTWTRQDDVNGSDREGKLLRRPSVGASLWLVINDVRWLRTTPIVKISTIERKQSLQIVVLTEGDRYTLEFDRWNIERANPPYKLCPQRSAVMRMGGGERDEEAEQDGVAGTAT